MGLPPLRTGCCELGFGGSATMRGSCLIPPARLLRSHCQRAEERSRTSRVTICRVSGSNKRGRPGAKLMMRGDGYDHLGSALTAENKRPFPGPPPGKGPPIRVLPIGGLGEIGMNCMLIGVFDRYILVDAGLMFPDITDLGMQKILPDTSFLSQWRDKIEAVVITHGHEDHIGALPWVYPALDPGTPIYAPAFPMQLVKRRLQEYNMYDESRMHVIEMREPFQLGPFMCEAARVTHSIPDCCGLVLRSEHGTIVHTGDWKIDEDPLDGRSFDRDFFEQLGREGVTLLMSDSTNVLAPGRTTSERMVEDALMKRVMGHQGKGRIVATQFASNIHRLGSLKKAADASGRKLAFIGMSLHMYLEAAQRVGQAPFSPRDVLSQADLADCDPNELLIVTTGSQAEPRAALSLAAREASHMLKLNSSDLVLYSAKIIPGNDTRVIDMMNRIAELGPEIAMGRDENLHTSGHAYRGELEEVLRYVKPQHFLPVHGEYAFLCAHAQLARENNVQFTEVIRNGQLLGVHDRRNARTVSTGSMAVLGEAALVEFYNDGNKGTGTAEEMALEERQLLAVEGIIIASVDVMRDPLLASASAAASVDPAMQAAASAAAARRKVRAKVRVTSRAMWVDGGRLLEQLHGTAEAAVGRLPGDASLAAVERVVTDAIRRTCKQYNGRRPDVVVIAHEADPRAGIAARAEATRRMDAAGRVAAGSASRPGAQDAVAAPGEQDKRRRGAQRERDLLFAGKGGEIAEFGAATEDSSDEDEEAGAPPVEGSRGDASPLASKLGGGRSAGRSSLLMKGQAPQPRTERQAGAAAAASASAAARRAALGGAAGGSRVPPPAPGALPPPPQALQRRRRAAAPEDGPTPP